jgi:S1-C subfamily serine protease
MEHQADGRTDSTPAEAPFPVSPPLYEPPHAGLPRYVAPSAPAPVPTPPTPSGDSTGVGWRAALIGGVVGAVLAILFGGALVLAFVADDESGSDPIEASADGGVDVKSILDRAQPSVVSISTGQETLGALFEGAGTGVIISEDGLVLTNDHVITGAETMTVDLPDGRTFDAELIGSFPANDIALIQLQGASGLTAAQLGSSAELEVGDPVVAIGNALGIGGSPTVTQGIVSALNRQISQEGITLDDVIQTDTAINHGNSGGPLVNAAGEVVGINTAVGEYQGVQTPGIGFAIAIDALKPLIEDLKAGEGAITQDTVFLGVRTIDVTTVPPDQLTTYGVETESGAFVASVTGRSAAEEAGLVEGDVIVEIDGQPVATPNEVGEAVLERAPGDEVEIVYERNGERLTATATLTTRADTDD